MEYWQYTLTGFSDFLEQRRIAFAEPMPACRICSICGRVPSSTAMLPCGHISCEQCRGEFFGGMECPFDGRAFTEGQLVRLCFQLYDLDNLRVFCLVGGNKCPTFAGKLAELRDHMRHCRSIGGQCAKCHRLVPSALAVDHYKRCCDGAPLLVCDVPLQTAVEEIREMKEDIEGLRQRALAEPDGDHDLANSANGLLERLARIDRALSVVPETVVGVDRHGDSLEPLRNQVLTPGPYRAASKPGAFIATCVFADVCSAHDSSKKGKLQIFVTTDNYTLGGYTFSLECGFSFSDGVEEVQFAMFLEDGDWNDYVEWPFSKKVTFVIAHPRDQKKDIRLACDVEGFEYVKKPRRGESNHGIYSEKNSWKDIELQGFIVKDALYVNVEFE